MCALNRALLHTVHHAECGHQFAAGMDGNGEFATRHFADFFGEHIGSAINGVQRLGEAGGQAPADGGLGMHSGGCSCGQHTGNACMLDE